MKKNLIVLLLGTLLMASVFANTGQGLLSNPLETAQGLVSLQGNVNDQRMEGIMAYCTLADLEGAYSAEQIAAWSRLDPDKVDKAIQNATAEIDGYLLSGGYSVPLAGPPKNLKKYCIDIAAASLVLGAGVLDNDPGGKAVLEEAKIARHYMEKVAEGKFKIPGYAAGSEVSKPPSGNVQVSSSRKLDLGGY